MEEKKAVVVDLGCGDPERRVSNSVTVDFNYDDVDKVEDVRDGLPFEDNSVDVMFSQAAFGYMWDNVDELRQRVDEVLRVLKPRGIFVVFDYCQMLDPEEEDYRNVTPNKMRKIWEEAVGSKTEVTVFGTDKANGPAGYSVLIRK